MGAILTYEYTCRYPDKVSSIVLSLFPLSDPNGSSVNLAEELYGSIKGDEIDMFYNDFISQPFKWLFTELRIRLLQLIRNFYPMYF
jgi:hypothetical protein